MIIQLNDIMKADIIQLEDYDVQLAFEIETVERQLQYADKKNDRVWHEKACIAQSRRLVYDSITVDIISLRICESI